MTTRRGRILGARSILLLATMLISGGLTAENDDGYVLFFDEYLYGDFYYAPVGDVDRSEPKQISPRRLRLPWYFSYNYEIGNADVSVQGRTLVFAARRKDELDWGVYTGEIDLRRRRIRNVKPLIQNSGVREEDPKFSWDGRQVVYKCDGNICIYPAIVPNPVVESWCELWAPSFSATGFAVSYTKRCDGGDSDRIWIYDIVTRQETPVPNNDGGPDRFAHFLDDGRVVYSHIDPQPWRSSLWVYDSGVTYLLHDQTGSDDDAYPSKHNRAHIAFIGWEDDGYSLYVYRQSLRDAVRLTRGIGVLGPMLFE